MADRYHGRNKIAINAGPIAQCTALGINGRSLWTQHRINIYATIGTQNRVTTSAMATVLIIASLISSDPQTAYRWQHWRQVLFVSQSSHSHYSRPTDDSSAEKSSQYIVYNIRLDIFADFWYQSWVGIEFFVSLISGTKTKGKTSEPNVRTLLIRL